MGKTRRHVRRDEETDDERAIRIMEQVKAAGRMPTPPSPQVFQTDRDKPGRKRDRRRENRELREQAESYNRGKG